MFDVLVIGGGLVGCAVAREIAESAPRSRIAIVDAGPSIGGTPFQHVSASTDPSVRARYAPPPPRGYRELFRGAERQRLSDGIDARRAQPGLYALHAFGHRHNEGFPAAALGWSAGGMGVRWTGATPDPSLTEAFGADWRRDLERARTILGVDPRPYGESEVGDRVIEVLQDATGTVAGDPRAPSYMPMAARRVQTDTGQRLVVAGPSEIFPDVVAPRTFDVVTFTNTLVTRVVINDGRAVGAEVRDLRGGGGLVSARHVVIAADPLRTPQLLHASGIRPWALGRYLNEHAFLSGQLHVDLDALGLGLDEVHPSTDDDDVVGCYVVPHDDGRRRSLAQITDGVYVDEAGRKLGYALRFSWYVPTRCSSDNRIIFGPEPDSLGLPRLDVRFHQDDLEADFEVARSVMAQTAQKIGRFDPGRDSAILAPGMSLHFTGTTRAGTDPSTSVTDLDGRVWGFENLLLAGGSVIPTAMAGNTTLPAVVTGVRAARAVAHAL